MFAVPIDPRLPAPPPADKSPLQETVAPPVTTGNLGEKYCLFFNVGLVVACFVFLEISRNKFYSLVVPNIKRFPWNFLELNESGIHK